MMQRVFLVLAALAAWAGMAHAGQMVSPVQVTACSAGQFFSGVDGTGTWTCGTPAGGVSLSGNNTWTGTQTFGPVNGSVRFVTAATDTMQASDCGETLIVTYAGAVTETVPSSIVPATGSCNVMVYTSTANKVTFSGSGVTVESPNSYTGTSGKAYDPSFLQLVTIGGAPTAVLGGSGS